jgi:biotin carboxylase
MNRGRTLLLLGAGFEQIEALRIARELGYATIAFDNDPDAVGRTHADVFERVDLKRPEALVERAKAHAPDGVFVHAAELAVEAAVVAEALGLAGVPVEVALDATDKSRRIQRLTAAGIATPRFEILAAATTDPARWAEQTKSIAYPKVLKPTNQAGARGVRLIADRVALDAYHAERHAHRSAEIVCEERLEGLQLSTESVARDGRCLHHAIALRHYDTTDHLLPCFIEDGHSMPYALPPALHARVLGVIERCFEALGIANGVLKGDLLIRADGTVFVLEMAARTSGGRFADTVVPLATGTNILYPLIELAMGDPFSRDWFTPTRSAGVSQRFFLHDRAGTVRRWPAIRRLVARPGVAEFRLDENLFRSGALNTIESHRDRLGYVICTAPTREEADHAALDITRTFAREIEIEARPASASPGAPR